MLETLLEILSSVDFEEYGDLLIETARWKDENLTLILQIEVRTDENAEFPSKWEIICSGVKNHKLNFGYAHNFTFDTNHVLSWEFTMPCCSVSFNGKADTPLAVVGALHKSHKEIAQNWIPFEKYFNKNLKLDELISGGFGQLVYSTPEEFSFAYERILQNYGFSTSRSKSRPPSFWNGEEFISNSVPLLTMIFDDSYIVAESFKAKVI